MEELIKMTDEKFELGIKIIIIVSVVFLICEILIAFGVFKKRAVSTSVLDDIEKNVSDSELLKEEDLNEIEDYYVEE